MSEIVEVPINSEEIPEIIEPEPEPEPTKPKPRAKGRPKGALGKKKKEVIRVNDVPKKKKKTKVISPSESEEEEMEVPPSRRRRIQQPVPQVSPVYEPPDTTAIAAQVLHMLSNRHLERSAAKREKYRSWFV